MRPTEYIQDWEISLGDQNGGVFTKP